MFTGLEPKGSSWRRYRAVGVSVGAHMALLAAIVFRSPRVIELAPTWLAWGNSAHSYQITYLPNGSGTPADVAKLVLPALASEPHPKPRLHTQKAKPADEDRQIEAKAESGDRDSRAGSPLGTVLDGPIGGHEVHVAYPIVFPDPPIVRSELPADVVGDVVIEVTIDSAGNVVETRILQAIGHGLDEKVEATLRRWHYQPATLDGVPVASKHDVHFHFPS